MTFYRDTIWWIEINDLLTRKLIFQFIVSRWKPSIASYLGARQDKASSGGSLFVPLSGPIWPKTINYPLLYVLLEHRPEIIVIKLSCQFRMSVFELHRNLIFNCIQITYFTDFRQFCIVNKAICA